MTGLRLAARQARFEHRAFWRNPAAAFFTFMFPLLFLVIMTSLLGNDRNALPTGPEVSGSTYYTGTILAFAVITATYTNIAMGVTIARDQGTLKRVRGTPLPPWVYLTGRVLHSALVMGLLVVVVLVFGRIFYDIALPTETLPAFLTTMLVGAAAFCALGLAISGLIPNADAAPAIVNATVLPLLFLSGVFIPIDDAPEWVRTLAAVFPVRHFLEASLESFFGPAPGWDVGSLVVVGLWGLGGLLVATRIFTWEPRR